MFIPDRQIVGSGTFRTLFGATASAANGDMSVAITSDPFELRQSPAASLEVVWGIGGGAPTGTFVIEACGGSWNPDRFATTNWIDVTALMRPAPTNPAGAVGRYLTDVPIVSGWRAIRLRYTPSGGGAANQLSVWATGKGGT
jgi:hypothetical protein